MKYARYYALALIGTLASGAYSATAHADQLSDAARNTACALYNNLSVDDQANAVKKLYEQNLHQGTPVEINAGLFLAKIGCLGTDSRNKTLGDIFSGAQRPNQNFPGVPRDILSHIPQLPNLNNNQNNNNGGLLNGISDSISQLNRPGPQGQPGDNLTNSINNIGKAVNNLNPVAPRPTPPPGPRLPDLGNILGSNNPGSARPAPPAGPSLPDLGNIFGNGK